MLTAACVELAQSEEWFWNTTPRVFVSMLEERRKIKTANYQLLAYIVNGGKIDEEGDTREGTPGLDYPAGEGATSWMTGG